jgi:hypothetical protein
MIRIINPPYIVSLNLIIIAIILLAGMIFFFFTYSRKMKRDDFYVLRPERNRFVFKGEKEHA